MPYVRVWVHLNWSTKYGHRIISPDLKKQLLTHILENAKSKEIYIDTINCVEEHIHLLISLGASQSLSRVVQLVVKSRSLCKIIEGHAASLYEINSD